MSDERAPPSIEGYRILTRLGHGSMGTVWRAVDRTGRDVAVKLPDRVKRIAAPQAEAMFRREALVALNLRHPNLVRGLDVGETTDGRPFLSMEFVEGETLGKRGRDRGPLPERDLVDVGRAVAAALEHAHALGLLHRDVKPDNVMLLPDGQVKLVDWSIAVERGHGELGCGSPGFASPEMIRKQEIGPASDLYALGVTLAVAALGRPYFQGADVKSVLRASLTVPVELPEAVDGTPLSDGFRAVVARLGRKDPAERYGSAGEVRLDFEALAHGQRPLGAYLGLARLRKALRPARWLSGLAGATALIWLVVLATSRSVAEPPPRRENAAAPPPSGTPGEAADPRAEVALLYVDAHPTEYAKARQMLGERLAASPSPAVRTRLEEASRRVEERFREAADERLAELTATAKTLAAGGDFPGATRVLSEWPEGLAGSPQETEAKRRATALYEEALGPGRRLLEEGDALLASAPEQTEEGASRDRELAARIDAELARAPREPVQRPRLVDLRARLDARIAAVARDRREKAARAALSTALARADAGDAPGARAALEALATPKDGWSETTALLSTVLETGRSVDAALAARLRPLAGKPWAGVVGGQWFVGKRDRLPAPRDVFAPVPRADAGSGPPAAHDLRDVLQDPEREASWIFLQAMPDAADGIAPEHGEVGRLLAVAGRARKKTGTASMPGGPAWEELARRMPYLVRVPGSAVPAAPPASDPLLMAWHEAIRGPRSAAPVKPSPALLAARTAFLDDDLLATWTALEQAAVAAPKDPEVAILRSRVLDALAKPARLLAVSLLALSEARRAWDLDPSLPASARLVAEGCLRFRSNHPGWHALTLEPLAVAACEEAARIGRADASMLAFVSERRSAEGRHKDAATWMRRAVREAPQDGEFALSLARAEDAAGESKRAVQALERARDLLGSLPPWASEMLARLSKR